MNSFSMKVNKLFTRKKALKTNLKGALNVEPQKSSKWEIGGAAASVAAEEIEAATKALAVAVTGGKLKEGKCSPLIYYLFNKYKYIYVFFFKLSYC